MTPHYLLIASIALAAPASAALEYAFAGATGFNAMLADPAAAADPRSPTNRANAQLISAALPPVRFQLQLTGMGCWPTLAQLTVRRVRVPMGNPSNVRDFSGSKDFVYSSAVSADGAVIIAGGEASVLRVWNGTNGQVVATFEPPQPLKVEESQ